MSRRCGLKKGIIPHQRESLTYQYWSDNGFPIQMSGMSGIMARARRKLMFTLKFESETAENKTKRNEIFMRQKILHPKTSNLAMQREIQKWGQGERTRGEIDSQRERPWRERLTQKVAWPDYLTTYRYAGQIFEIRKAACNKTDSRHTLPFENCRINFQILRIVSDRGNHC